MAKVAVILAGCGHKDGSEIRESVIALLALDKENAEVTIFAPDRAQKDVVDHAHGKSADASRNLMVEAARIARGEIKPLNELKAGNFDALVIPGGFGVAKNFSDIADKGKEASYIDPEFQRVVKEFHTAEKPIGAICIAPAVVTLALKGTAKAHVTIGDDADGLIAALGGEHQQCATRGIVIDDANHIVSCSAYMRNDRLSEIASGIEKLVEVVINHVHNAKKAA